MDASQLKSFKKGEIVTITHRTQMNLALRVTVLHEYDDELGRIELVQGRSLFMVKPNDKFWDIA